MIKYLHVDKIGYVDKEIPEVGGFGKTTTSNAKINEVENKILDTSGLVNTIVLDTKIGDFENKIPVVSD